MIIYKGQYNAPASTVEVLSISAEAVHHNI